MKRVFIFVVIGFWIAFAGFAVWKTRQEVNLRWRGEDSTAWVEKAAEWNPWLALPNPNDIAEGRDPVRPVREVAEFPARSELHLRWRSAPFDCDFRNERTMREDGEQFAARAGSDANAMLRAFPAR